MKTSLIILALAFVVICIIFFIYRKKDKKCLNQNHDLDYYNQLGESHRPHVALQNHCNHSGDKTLVTVSSIVTCETVQTICDDCGCVLNTETDCR